MKRWYKSINKHCHYKKEYKVWDFDFFGFAFKNKHGYYSNRDNP